MRGSHSLRAAPSTWTYAEKKWNIFAWAKQQSATSSSHGRRQQVGWGLMTHTGFKAPFTLVKNNKKGTKRWGGRGGINQNDLHQPKWICRTRTAASFFHEDLKAVNKAENHWELCPCVWTNEEANMIYSPFITFLNQILQLCANVLQHMLGVFFFGISTAWTPGAQLS